MSNTRGVPLSRQKHANTKEVSGPNLQGLHGVLHRLRRSTVDNRTVRV